MTALKFAELPALGDPLEDGIFAGITTKPDGTHCAVVLLPAKGTNLTWKKAMNWAKKLGGELPTRTVAALLVANVEDKLELELHWTADELNTSYAWACHFYFGTQSSYKNLNELAAVAVRTIVLE